LSLPQTIFGSPDDADAIPLWGVPRIHGELLKLGFGIAQSTVAKDMAKGRRSPSQSWKTVLQNHAAGIAVMDFFVVATIGFRLLYTFVILRHDRRRIISIGVTTHPAAQWIARQIIEAFPWNDVPRSLIRDRDAAYGHVYARWGFVIDRPLLGRPGRTVVSNRLLAQSAARVWITSSCSTRSTCAGSWMRM
jgi:hypothetical protein